MSQSIRWQRAIEEKTTYPLDKMYFYSIIFTLHFIPIWGGIFMQVVGDAIVNSDFVNQVVRRLEYMSGDSSLAPRARKKATAYIEKLEPYKTKGISNAVVIPLCIWGSAQGFADVTPFRGFQS
jgi:hypothetical protein